MCGIFFDPMRVDVVPCLSFASQGESEVDLLSVIVPVVYLAGSSRFENSPKKVRGLAFPISGLVQMADVCSRIVRTQVLMRMRTSSDTGADGYRCEQMLWST